MVWFSILKIVAETRAAFFIICVDLMSSTLWSTLAVEKENLAFYGVKHVSKKNFPVANHFH